MKDERTNEQFLMDLMQFSPAGALAQCVIIEAIDRYVTQVANASARPKGWPKNALINWDAWKLACVHIRAEIRKKYDGPARKAR